MMELPGLRLRAPEKGQYRKDKKDDEEDFGNARRTGRDATKSQNSSDYRDDKEDDCVIKHDGRPRANY
jgi:hypothetical protein